LSEEFKIYVDPIFYHPGPNGNCWWSHMGVSDRSPAGLEFLHQFAESLGLKRAWFQDKGRHKHYDLYPSKRALAITKGAIEVDQRSYVKLCSDNERLLKLMAEWEED
jgi:hypothetical protein